MIARLDNLRNQPVVVEHLTGLSVTVFDELAVEVVPAVEDAHRKGLDRPDRKRAIGGGDDFDLATADQLLLIVNWLRQYPTNEVLGFLFGVFDSTASRARAGCCRFWTEPARTRCGCPIPAQPGASDCRRC